MNALTEIIRGEIAERGFLPFPRFMELALYCPKHGYYETKKDNPGRRGDYYTSVGVGEVFGQLLAFQFANWSATFNLKSATVNLVEAGAHDGRLARDILGWLQLKRPELFGRIEYWIIEPSAQRREWQEETLDQYSPQVRWIDGLENLKPRAQNPKLTGVIFSNELLDAMPVHRYGWDAGRKVWYEWGVGVDGEKFIWARMPDIPAPQSRERDGVRKGDPSSTLNLPASLLEVLPDGYTIETSPAAESWWREAAKLLERGRLLAIDYGLTADELIMPNRLRGTLRAYYRHHASGDVLANVGEQDLTAHVNFSALQAAGESAGLKTESFSTQSQFLTQILRDASKVDLLGEWTPARTRQFQTLTHPEHLGRAFRVLVQSR